jgi:hypothetical protein
VHEEVLRMLLAAAPLMSPVQLGTYLQMTLENSKKSRKRVKKHLSSSDPLADFPLSMVSPPSSILRHYVSSSCLSLVSACSSVRS